MNLRKLLGQSIKIKRIETGLTQEALANKCGLTKSDISRIENGIPNSTISHIERVINGLDQVVVEIKMEKINN